MGYACMRLEDYLSAREHFALAHRIDSRRAALRLAMHDLREMIRTMRLRKRRRVEASTEQRRVAMKAYFLPCPGRQPSLLEGQVVLPIAEFPPRKIGRQADVACDHAHAT
jgi:hypothetical protein